MVKKYAVAWVIVAICCGIMNIQAAVMTVPGDYPTILNAYQRAEPHDTILVKPGVYHGDGWCEVQLFGKSVSVISEAGPENTIIDGWGEARGFIIKDIPDSEMVIDGFTFLDCVGFYTGAVGFFRNSSITFRNCIVIRGKATSTELPVYGEGGGIRIWGSSPTITDCVIKDCWAYQGGGFNILENSYPLIRRCTIDNCFGSGFQISTNTASIIEDCQITNNEASDYSWAGGFGSYDNSDSIVRNCLIGGNVNNISDAAGIRIEDSSPEFINCLIIDNRSATFGAGILCRDHAYPVFEFCTVANNFGQLNGSGAMSCVSSNPVFRNCIIWNPLGREFYTESGGRFDLQYCDIRGGYTGEGNYSADPLFAEGPEGDFYLSCIASGQAQDSPCLDKGDTDSQWKFNTFYGSVRLSDLTTSTSQLSDVGIADTGFHARQVQDAEFTGVTIEMPLKHYVPDDLCSVDVIVHNAGPDSLIGKPLFVVLDILGEFYCAPGFSSFDYYSFGFSSGVTRLSILDDFSWPSGAGSFSGVTWYAGFSNREMTELLGEMGMFTFSWGESLVTPTPSPSVSVTPSATPSATPSTTPEVTGTATPTPLETAGTPTATPLEATPTPSATPATSPDPTPVKSPTPEVTPTLPSTATPSPSPSPSPLL